MKPHSKHGRGTPAGHANSRKPQAQQSQRTSPEATQDDNENSEWANHGTQPTIGRSCKFIFTKKMSNFEKLCVSSLQNTAFLNKNPSNHAWGIFLDPSTSFYLILSTSNQKTGRRKSWCPSNTITFHTKTNHDFPPFLNSSVTTSVTSCTVLPGWRGGRRWSSNRPHYQVLGRTSLVVSTLLSGMFCGMVWSWTSKSNFRYVWASFS